MNKDILVKKSKINGKGVFAARDFKKGETVLKWDISHKISLEKFRKLTKKQKRYVSYLKGKYILMQPPERYVNHSCDANTYAHNFRDIAKKKINKGEEITTNYTKGGSPGQKFRCRCGSKKCKIIVKT